MVFSLLFNTVYLLLLFFCSPLIIWNGWRKGSLLLEPASRWLGLVSGRSGTQRLVWLHAVSVGEINLLRPIVDALSREHPTLRFAISSTTASGLKLAREQFPHCIVFRMPLDFSWAVKCLLKRLRPSMIVLAELEVWPNLIRVASRQSIPVCIVNGRLSEASHRGYRKLKPLVRPTFSQIGWVGAQNDEYAQRFIDLGVHPSKVVVSGNIKFDNCSLDPLAPQANATRQLIGLDVAGQDKRFRQSDAVTGQNFPVWVVGSTQAGEERVALEAFVQLRTSFPRLRMILVPRHPERFGEVHKLAHEFTSQVACLSVIKRGASVEPWEIMLGDTVGDLRWLWSLADIAFVGGSFGDRGGQNMMEPAAYGASVAVGPNTKNFRQVMEMFRVVSGIRELRDRSDMVEWAAEQLSNDELRHAAGRRAQQVIREHVGALDRTVSQLKAFIVAADAGQVAGASKISVPVAA